MPWERNLHVRKYGACTNARRPSGGRGANSPSDPDVKEEIHRKNCSSFLPGEAGVPTLDRRRSNAPFSANWFVRCRNEGIHRPWLSLVLPTAQEAYVVDTVKCQVSIAHELSGLGSTRFVR